MVCRNRAQSIGRLTGIKRRNDALHRSPITRGGIFHPVLFPAIKPDAQPVSTITRLPFGDGVHDRPASCHFAENMLALGELARLR
jgi:hypothetical protein